MKGEEAEEEEEEEEEEAVDVRRTGFDLGNWSKNAQDIDTGLCSCLPKSA